jgi:hypothetical protein
VIRGVHLAQEIDVKRQPAVQTSRAEAIALLSRCCCRLLLQPDDGDARDVLAFVLATVPLTFCEEDSLLITALVKEAQAHAEELAYRLEAPGYSSLYIAATTARLHQTLSILQLQLSSEVAGVRRQTVAA